MQTYVPVAGSIMSFEEQDRPREKMMRLGKSALNDAELMGILIGSGTFGENAINLAAKILASANNDFSELGRRTPKDLVKGFKGIGEAKAVAIVAALEIGRRRQFSDARRRERITCSRDIYEAVALSLIDLEYEEFHIILLNRASHIISKILLSKGGVAGVVVDAKMIFKAALEALASSIILCHNHPSGNLLPSQSDIDLTKKLQEGAKLLDMTVLDHVIVAKTGYFSFADEGKM